MNKKQKTCLLIGIAAMVVMGLFPPWVLQTEKRYFLGGRSGYQRYEITKTTEAGPYSWIGYPPSRPKAARSTAFSDREDLEATARFIDLYRLGLQFFVVAVVTAGLIVILKDKSPTENKSPAISTRDLFFLKLTVVFSVVIGFIIPAIIIFVYFAHDNWDWDWDMLQIWYMCLRFSAGIWILYGIIRWVIIPISRWIVKIPTAKGRLKMIILAAGLLFFVFVSGLLLWHFTPHHIPQRIDLSDIVEELRSSEQKTNKKDTNKDWLSILESAAINDANENSK